MSSTYIGSHFTPVEARVDVPARADLSLWSIVLTLRTSAMAGTRRVLVSIQDAGGETVAYLFAATMTASNITVTVALGTGGTTGQDITFSGSRFIVAGLGGQLVPAGGTLIASISGVPGDSVTRFAVLGT